MTNVLSSVSEELAAVVEASSDKVVSVRARRRLPATGFAWSSDGVVVTAHHVLESDENIQVGLPGGETAQATLAGRDAATDVAVLRVPSGGLAAPSWAEPGSLRVGNLVMALGRPGREVMATLGIVSATGEGWRTPAGGLLEGYVQPDTAMYPGFSGGPLVDVAGRFVGMNTSALARGMALTVATLTLRRVVEALLAHGRVRRAYLGIGAQTGRLPASIAQQAGQDTAVLLVSVEAGSPGDRGGLLLGDAVLAVDGRPVRILDDLLALLTGDLLGQCVTLRILRAGQLQDIALVVGERG